MSARPMRALKFPLSSSTTLSNARRACLASPHSRKLSPISGNKTTSFSARILASRKAARARDEKLHLLLATDRRRATRFRGDEAGAHARDLQELQARQRHLHAA